MYYLIVTWEVINIVCFFRISHRFSFLFGVFPVVCLHAVSFVPFARVSRLSHSLLFVFVLCLLSHLHVSLDCLILFCLSSCCFFCSISPCLQIVFLFCLSSCCVFCAICPCLQIVSFSFVCLRAVSFVPFARVSRLSHSLLFVFVLCLLSHLPVSLDCLILFCLSSCFVFCSIYPCLQIVSFSFVCFRAVSFVPFARVSRLSHSLLFVFVLCLLSHSPVSLDCLILCCLSSCCVFCPICPCLQIVSFSVFCLRAVSFVPFARVSRLSHSLLFVFVMCPLSHLSVSLDYLILFCLSSCCVFCPICPCLQIVSFFFVCLRALFFVPFVRVSRLSHSLLLVFVLCLLSHLRVSLDCLILFCLSSSCVFCPIYPCLQIVSFSFVCFRAVSFAPFVRVSRLSHSLLFVFVLCLLSHLPVYLDYLILFCLSSCCVLCPICPCLQIVSFSFVCLRAVSFVPFVRVSRLSHSLLFVFVLFLLFHLPVSLDCLIIFCLSSCCVFCPICPCLQIVSFSFVCFCAVYFVPFVRVSRLSHSLLFVFVLCLLSHLTVSLDCLILFCLSSCCIVVPFVRVSRLSHSLLFVFVLYRLSHLPVSLDCLILFCLSSCGVFCPICPCLQIISFSFVCLRAVSFVPFARVSRLSHSLLFVFVLCLLSHLPVSLDCLILFCLSSCFAFCPICPCLQIVSFSVVCLRAVSFVPFVRVSRLSHSLLFVFVLCLLSHLPVSLDCLILFSLSSCCVFCPTCLCLQIVSFSVVCLRAVSFVPFARVSRLSHSLLFVFVLCLLSHLPVSLDCLILFSLSSCCVFCPICPCLQIVSFSFVCFRAVSFVPFACVPRLSHSLLFVFVLYLLSHLPVFLDYLILFCLSSCCVVCPICPCLQIVSFSFVFFRAVSFVPFATVSRLSHSLLFVFVLCLLSHLPVSLDCLILCCLSSWCVFYPICPCLQIISFSLFVFVLCLLSHLPVTLYYLILFCLSSCCVFCPICPCLQIVSFSFVCLRAVSFVPFVRVSRLSHSLLLVFVLCLLSHLPVSLDCLILFCLSSCCVFCPIYPCLQIVSFSFVCLRAVPFVPFARVSRLSHSLLFVFVLCLLFHLPVSLDCLILFCLFSCCVFCPICPCLQIVSFSFALFSCCVFCPMCPCLQIVSFSFVCFRGVSFVPFARVSRLSHSLFFVFVLCLLSHLPVSLDCLILCCLSSCCVFCPICPCLQIVSFSFVCLRAVSFVPFTRVSRLSHSLLFVFVLCLLSHFSVSLDCLILFCLFSCCVFCSICPCLQIVSFSFVCFRAVSFVPFARVSRLSHSLLFVFVLCPLSHLSVSLDCLILFCLSSCCVFCPICSCLQIVSFSFVCFRAVSIVPFARVSRLSHYLLFVFVLCLLSHLSVSLDCLILFCLFL